MLSDLAANSNSVNEDSSSVISSRIDEDLNSDSVEPDPVLVAKLIRETREMLRSRNKNNYNGPGKPRGRDRRDSISSMS